jgi:hypothetical protein
LSTFAAPFAFLKSSTTEIIFILRFEPHSDVKNLLPVELPGTDFMAFVSQLEIIP